MSKLEEFYNRRYKLILLIPLAILVLSILFIGSFNAKNGDYVHKDVSLKGGVSATVYLDNEFDIENIREYLDEELDKEVFVRSLATVEDIGQGFLIETSKVDGDELRGILGEYFNIEFNDENFFVEETGSKLGDDFYRQMIRAVITAFILMGITIFIVFRKFIPSIAVILSAFLDIVGTIALIDLFGIRISATGVAALLLLLGYSVDTDVLLTTNMIKRKEGTVWERITSSAKTGLTMTVTTMAAMIVGYSFASSIVLKQMFLIIFLGLIVDIISTYTMNAGLLKWYLEKKDG